MYRASNALAAARAPDLRQRIAEFVTAASTEITPHDEALVPALVEALPPGATVYVAHTPKATLYDVLRVSVDLQARGLSASPHIVARRLESEEALRSALSTLRTSGIEQALLIAGDRDSPAGPYASTLDIIDSGVLSEAGLPRIGFAGHPEGHPAIDSALLWDALRRKQEFADRTGISVHIATQFGFDAAAVFNWVEELQAAGIRLPVHVGVAGPTSLTKLLRFAVQCGVKTSLQAALKNPGTIGALMGMNTTPGEMVPALIRLGAGEVASQMVKPHIFTFGGALASANWIRAVGSGEFELLRDGSIEIG
jgi:methylenetetrahydrofolate reductase (NADPH)